MIKATRNQLANCSNPYQSGARRVLCVCSAGLLRSPTMASVLHTNAGYNTRAAGSSEDFALIPVSEVLIRWADEIVFVEKHNQDEVLANNPDLRDVVLRKSVVLNVPDQYGYNEPMLRSAIWEQYINEGDEDASTK